MVSITVPYFQGQRTIIMNKKPAKYSIITLTEMEKQAEYRVTLTDRIPLVFYQAMSDDDKFPQTGHLYFVILQKQPEGG